MEKFYATQSKSWKYVKTKGEVVEDYFGNPKRAIVEGKGKLIVSKVIDDWNIRSEPILERNIDLEENDWIAPEELFYELKRDWSHGNDLLVVFDDVVHDVEYKMYEKHGKLVMKTKESGVVRKKGSSEFETKSNDEWWDENL